MNNINVINMGGKGSGRRAKKPCPHGFHRIKDCLECQKEYSKEYRNRPKVKEQHRKRQRIYNKRLRERVLKLLGNKCANPFNLPHPNWCNDQRCLQIDHIHGNGINEDSRRGTAKYHRKVLKDLSPYQLLCANCNWIKRSKNKEYREEGK